MKKEQRCNVYLESRVEALENFYNAVYSWFKCSPYVMEQCIPPKVLKSIKDTTPLTTEEIHQKMVETITDFALKEIRRKKSRLNIEEQEYIIRYIKHHNLLPDEGGSSLHAWDKTYYIDGKYYNVWGYNGSSDPESVDLIDES